MRFALVLAACVALLAPDASGQLRPAIPELIRNDQGWPAAGRTWLTAFGDLDGDGDLDAVFANLDAPSAVLLNDGSGVFHRSERRLPAMAFFSDLNRDGLVDLVAGEWGKGIRVRLNDGTGAFRERSFLSMPTATYTNFAFEDMDGDGDKDIFLTDTFHDHHGLWFNQLRGGDS